MIVIDSNQLMQAPPGSPVWLLLKAVGEQTGHSLAISDVSLWESLNKARALIEADNQAASNAVKKLKGRLAAYGEYRGQGRGGVSSERVNEVIRQYEARLRKTFQVLATPPSAAVEALHREALRLPPCKPSGDGGRDTSIWLTAVGAAASEHAATATALPLIFVSRDKGFADPEDEKHIHPSLHADLPDGLDVVLCRSIPDAFAAISEPADASCLVVDTSSKEIIEQIVTAVIEGALPDRPEALGTGTGVENSRVFTVGDLLRAAPVLFEGFHETPKRSKGPDQTVVVGTGSWRFLPPPEELGRSMEARLAQGQRYAFGERVQGESFEVTATLVWTLVNGALGDVQVAHVSHSARLSGTATRVTAHDDGHISTEPVELGPDGSWVYSTRFI